MEVDGVSLNSKILDEIVLNYVAHEGLIWARGVRCQEMASLRMQREAIDHICSTTNEGQIEEAILLIEECNASTLHDQKLLFHLQKQQLLELLRNGSDEKAVQCARKSLEPLALNAYLEAYQDFKQVMLAFLFGPQDIDSPIADQWSLKQRSQLAGTVAADLRAALAAYDPLLSLLLRYLVSIQRRFLEVAGNLQVSPRLGRLLQELSFVEKDPPLLPKSSLNSAPDFKEKDVQDLAHAVELPRQAAVDSLRVANGDVLTGLKNEVSRMRVNRTFVDELAREYLVYRGHLEGDPALLVLAGQEEQDPRPMQKDDTNTESMPLNGRVGCTAESESRSIAEPVCPTGRTIDDDAGATGRDQDGDVQMGDGQIGDHSEAGQGDSIAPPPDPLPVWRGRPEGFRERVDRSLGLHLDHLPTTAAMPSGPLRQGSVHEYLGTAVLGADVAHRYRKVVEIRDLASAGAMGLAVDATLVLVPDFFADKPELLFRLKEVEFVKLLDAGEYQLALRLARDSLGPLAAAHRALLPALKATLLAFAKPGIHHPITQPTTAALATALQESLAAAVGVPEPLLVVLMRSLIDAHDEWFDMQMCEDPFRGFFNLDALKSVEGDEHAAMDTAAEGAEVAHSAGEQSVADESILTLMEFLAISRGDAILLLEKFDGSVEAVFADKLGGD